MLQRPASALVLSALLLGLAGCGDDSPPTPPPPDAGTDFGPPDLGLDAGRLTGADRGRHESIIEALIGHHQLDRAHG